MAFSFGKWSRSLVSRLEAGLHRALGRPWFGVLLGPLLAVLALFLAYRSPSPVTLNVGDSYTQPYVTGFFQPEKWAGGDYAYTSAYAALRLDGIGWALARVEVRMGGGVPGVRQLVSAGRIPLSWVEAGGDLATYTFLVPAEAGRGGGLVLTWEGPTASPQGDPRQLGLAVDRVTWEPVCAVTPDGWQVFWLALAALALYFVARGLDLPAGWAAALSAALVVAVSLGVALARLYVTIYTPRLAVLLVAVALLLPLARRGTRALLVRLGMSPPPAVDSWLWRVTALAALVKLGGVLYPHIIVLDAGAHSYRVHRFLSGDWGNLFLPSPYSLLGQTVGLEGGQFPYAPLFHVLSVPLTLLPLPLPLAMGLFNGLLEVARNVLLYLFAARIGGRPRVGLWAAVFYTFLPAPYYLLSWGNYPTQLGLFGALVAVVYLVLSYEHLGKRPTLGRWVAALVLAILSYTVVGLMAVALLFLLILLEWLLASGPRQRRRAGAVLAGLLLAEGLVFLLYHSAFADTLLRETLPAVLRAMADKATGLGPVTVDPRESLASNWVANWIFVQNHLTELGVVFSALGVVLVWIAPAGRRWRPLLLAWPLVFLLFALFSGLVADMVLKHVFFMFPWLCLGAAVLAVTLWRRGLAGRLVVLAYTALMVWLSLSHWVEFILVKRH